MNIGIVISPIADLQNIPIRKTLPEPMFYERLTDLGNQQHSFVYVFRATDFNANKMCLIGYRFEQGQWKKQLVPLPDIVFDRTFHHHKLHYQKHLLYMKQLESKHHFLYFNASLPNKLSVYEQLKLEFPQIIPPAKEYEHFSELEAWLDNYDAGVILKPLSGMHGKGIIRVQKKEGLYSINGRQLNNQTITSSFSSSLKFQKWLLYFRHNHSYLLQPYYHLRTAENEPFDIRVLMQKNENGIWQVSGSVARVGKSGSLTSNLHGGGQIHYASTILEQLFYTDKAARLLSEIHMISGQIAEHVEACFGRFGELALDFGITDKGNIVMLECNSKPGRQAFLHDEQYADEVILQPLSYASYLYRHYIQFNKNVNHYKTTSIIQ